MEKRKVYSLFIVIVIILFAFNFYFLLRFKSLEGKTLECLVDSDCVPSACCHATSCVALGDSPDCTDVACTLDCQPETLDCGGSCLCDRGKCSASIPN